MSNKEGRRRDAVTHVVFEGARSAAVMLCALTVAHVGLQRFSPWYQGLSIYPKRIVFACGLIGSFWFPAQLAAGRNVQAHAALDAAALEAEDDAHRRALAARVKD